PAALTGARDTDHLEVALALRERGVEVVLVTQDTGLRARALTYGLSVIELSEKHQLPPEETPDEADRRRRRELEGILEPPRLRLTVEKRQPSSYDGWILSIECTSEGGQAAEVRVAWNTDSREVSDRLDGSVGGLLNRSADGRFTQRVPGIIPPGGKVMLAEMIPRPTTIDYVIWAATSLGVSGQLRWRPDYSDFEDIRAVAPP